MTYRKKGRATLALMLAMLLLLAGCGTAAGPQSDASVQSASPAPAATADDGSTLVNVSTVDELLAAIAPNTTIVLADGVYDLSTASDYGKDGGEYYGWAEAYDGSQLNISGVKGLTLKAEDAEKVTIAAIPRYANVISFSACTDLTVSDLTLGHTEEPGQCAGGVLEFNSCDNVLVNDCALYGCGIIGVQAYDCRTVHTVDTEIYDCSIGAAYAESCRDVLFDGCEIYDCTADFTGLFDFVSCNEVAVINSEIHDNTAQRLVCSSYTGGLYMAALEVSNNSFSSCVFASAPNAITLEGCSLSGNTAAAWYGPYPYNDMESVMCVSPDGTELDDMALAAMKLGDDVTWTAKPQKSLSDEIKLEASEDGAIHVSTVDELLASIAPDTKIYLEDGVYNLSDASDYGTLSDGYYSWGQSYDGPELLISGVDNLTIMAKSPELVTIAAVPRYANVLKFTDCSNLLLSGFTAGHTEEPGQCAGGVLLFEGADKVRIENCSLFGCGIMGITASGCADIDVTGTEIYDCSLGAVSASGVKGMSFTNCDIHDCATPEFSLNDCTGVSYDDKAIQNGQYKMSDGKLADWTGIDAS